MNIAYYLYEAALAFAQPARTVNNATQYAINNSTSPINYTTFGRAMSSACKLFERTTHKHTKPEFGFNEIEIKGKKYSIKEHAIWNDTFCTVLHFERQGLSYKQPKLLIIAPMSGNYATLLRETVEPFLSDYDVYITDWYDASTVPLSKGRFDLDDYIDYVINILRDLGPDTHVMGVSQSTVPVIAAVSRLEALKDPAVPRSMVLMAGPIDTRESPTLINELAQECGIEWFKRYCTTQVPFTRPGFMREVYPGFLQLFGFMAMNLNRRLTKRYNMFQNSVAGDDDPAEKHRRFYEEYLAVMDLTPESYLLNEGDDDSTEMHTQFHEEYLAVMDLTAEFFLQTIDEIFVKRSLPQGQFLHRGEQVDPSLISHTALMTVEGECDDISGIGQTKAAHNLCPHIPDSMREHYLQLGVGHYGVFRGKRFASDIAPRIKMFIDRVNASCDGGQ